MKKETKLQELMIRYLEYTNQLGSIITDRISIYFVYNEVWIYKLGNYYDKLYQKIKHMNKEQIKEYFKPKHNYNFIEAC